MGCTDTIGVIIYWNPYQPFVTHRAHHVEFYEYNFRLFIEDNHTKGCLLLQQDTEIHVHNSYLLKFVPCELYITTCPVCDTTTIKYEIELTPYEKKVGFNLLDDKEFTIPYITVRHF